MWAWVRNTPSTGRRSTVREESGRRSCNRSSCGRRSGVASNRNTSGRSEGLGRMRARLDTKRGCANGLRAASQCEHQHPAWGNPPSCTVPKMRSRGAVAEFAAHPEPAKSRARKIASRRNWERLLPAPGLRGWTAVFALINDSFSSLVIRFTAASRFNAEL